jgi:hypothetical protein
MYENSENVQKTGLFAFHFAKCYWCSLLIKLSSPSTGASGFVKTYSGDLDDDMTPVGWGLVWLMAFRSWCFQLRWCWEMSWQEIDYFASKLVSFEFWFARFNFFSSFLLMSGRGWKLFQFVALDSKIVSCYA